MKRIIQFIALLVVASACSQSAINQSKFESLYRSAKSIQAATTVGVTHLQFSELLQGLATEIFIAKDKATSAKEKELVALYAKVLDAYQDSLIFWKLKNESSILGSILVPNGSRTSLLAEKYHLPIKTYHIPTDGGGERLDKYVDDGALKTIWAVAERTLDQANKLYSQGASQKPTSKP